LHTSFSEKQKLLSVGTRHYGAYALVFDKMKCSQKIATGPDMKIIMNASLFRTIAMADILYLAVAMNTMPARAQETGASDSIVALAADSQSLPQIAATAAPARGGTYWWVYPGGMAVPTPMLPLDFYRPDLQHNSQ